MTLFDLAMIPEFISAAWVTIFCIVIAAIVFAGAAGYFTGEYRPKFKGALGIGITFWIIVALLTLAAVAFAFVLIWAPFATL